MSRLSVSLTALGYAARRVSPQAFDMESAHVGPERLAAYLDHQRIGSDARDRALEGGDHGAGSEEGFIAGIVRRARRMNRPPHRANRRRSLDAGGTRRSYGPLRSAREARAT